MHDFFHNRTVIIPQTISITHIHISLVSVWEGNFVLCNSMLKYVINRLMHAFSSYQDCRHPSTDIDPRAETLWPISLSRDDNNPHMEKGMH